MKSSFLILLFSILFFAATPEAEAARTDCSAQMVVLDEDNNFVESSVTYEIRFYENESPTGGEVELAAAVTGSGTPTDGLLDLTFDCQADLLAVSDTVYMEIDLNGETLSPRTELTSVPFAALAGTLLGEGGEAVSITGGDFVSDGSGNLIIDNNAVTLGTDTTGDYVASLTAGSGISITGGSGEGSTPTISLGAGAVTGASITDGSITSADVEDDSLDFDKFEDSMTLDGDLTIAQGTNSWAQTFTRVDGSGTYGWTLNAPSLESASAFSIQGPDGTAGSNGLEVSNLATMSSFLNDDSSLLSLLGTSAATGAGAENSTLEASMNIGSNQLQTAMIQKMSLTDANVGNNILYGEQINITTSNAPKVVHGEDIILSTTTPSGTLTNYGSRISVSGTGTPGVVAVTNYGMNISMIGSAQGDSINYGLYVATSGADENYAAYFSGDVLTNGAQMSTVSAQSVDDASDTVNAAGVHLIVLSNASGGSLTLTSAPTIIGGSVGQEIRIIGGNADPIVFQDLPGLSLGLSGDRTLGENDVLTLVTYTGTFWVEAAFTNN